MKIFLNNNEIEYLCKLLNIEVKVLFMFEISLIKTVRLDLELESGLIKKNAIAKKDGVINVSEDIVSLFKLWSNYKNSVKLLTEKSFSLQAVMDEEYVLLISSKGSEYVFEFEQASELVYHNAMKTVAAFEDLNGEDSFVIILNLNDVNNCFTKLAKNETTAIDKIANSQGLDSNELLEIFKIFSDKEAEQHSVITESKERKIKALIKIAKISDCHITLKMIDKEDRVVMAKGSTNYVLDSMYNF